jgi:hypothetical protein
MALAKRKKWWRYLAFFVCSLAFVNLVSVPYRFGRLCFYNWSDAWWDSLLVFVATFALLSKHLINRILAALAVLPGIYDYAIEIMALWGYRPLAQMVAESGMTSETWWRIMRLHLADFATPVLALLIVIYTVVKLFLRLCKPTAQDLR